MDIHLNQADGPAKDLVNPWCCYHCSIVFCHLQIQCFVIVLFGSIISLISTDFCHVKVVFIAELQCPCLSPIDIIGQDRARISSDLSCFQGNHGATSHF